MRIAMMGAGGIGGYFGGKLAKAGHEVTFIARGRHLAALREQGLTIEAGGETLHLPRVAATDDPSGVGPVDLVILGVKLWDTEAAAQAVRPLVEAGASIVSFQNGVQKDEVLRQLFGPGPILGGVSYIAASIARPGVIAQVGTMQRLVFGEFDGSRTSRVETFHRACQDAGIDAEIAGDVRRATWEKFVFLVGLSGSTTLMRQSIGPIRENPQTRAFLLDLMREVVQVGRAQGIALAEDFAENRLAFCDGLPAATIASMYGDLQRGNRLETPWLSGGVVALGQAVGVPTPLNRAVSDALALYVDGQAG